MSLEKVSKCRKPSYGPIPARQTTEYGARGQLAPDHRTLYTRNILSVVCLVCSLGEGMIGAGVFAYSYKLEDCSRYQTQPTGKTDAKKKKKERVMRELNF